VVSIDDGPVGGGMTGRTTAHLDNATIVTREVEYAMLWDTAMTAEKVKQLLGPAAPGCSALGDSKYRDVTRTLGFDGSFEKLIGQPAGGRRVGDRKS